MLHKVMDAGTTHSTSQLESGEGGAGRADAEETLIDSKVLLECALPTWYHSLKDFTIHSLFVELSDDFVDYLSHDGCVLPQGCALPSFPQQPQSDGEKSDEGAWSEEELEEVQAAPSFPSLVTAISDAIGSLGSSGVFPKLNWSAPRDASWISSTGNLCCTTPAEVILLLKSSEFISHDLSLVSAINLTRDGDKIPMKSTLCLRAWQDIVPSSEFRCFISERGLLGVAQRNIHTHFPYLLPLKKQLLEEIQVFILHVQSHTHLKQYVCDIARRQEGTYILLDLNPFLPSTDPLLFEWAELQGWEGPAELRLVEEGCVQPSPLQSYRLPKDLLDLTTGADIHKFVDLLQTGAMGNT